MLHCTGTEQISMALKLTEDTAVIHTFLSFMLFQKSTKTKVKNGKRKVCIFRFVPWKKSLIFFTLFKPETYTHFSKSFSSSCRFKGQMKGKFGEHVGNI